MKDIVLVFCSGLLIAILADVMSVSYWLLAGTLVLGAVNGYMLRYWGKL